MAFDRPLTTIVPSASAGPVAGRSASARFQRLRAAAAIERAEHVVERHEVQRRASMTGAPDDVAARAPVPELRAGGRVEAVEIVVDRAHVDAVVGRRGFARGAAEAVFPDIDAGLDRKSEEAAIGGRHVDAVADHGQPLRWGRAELPPPNQHPVRRAEGEHHALARRGQEPAALPHEGFADPAAGADADALRRRGR